MGSWDDNIKKESGKMKIVVLGSDGQIGAPLTEHLKKLGHQVYEFDIESNILEDLRVPNILNSVLSEVDFVFFLAFDVGGANYLKKYEDTHEFISNNVKIMSNTFDSLKKYGTPFIFTSSQMSGLINSSYGILKRIGEKYTKSLNGKVVKLWNVYGFEKDIMKSHVITDFILMAKNNNRIDMKTNGIEKRQFLYTDDCSQCLTILMDRFYEIEEELLDVSSFEWISIVDLSRIISSNFNNCPIYPGNDVDDVQKNSLIDPGDEILKYWGPRTSINDGVKKMISKYNG